MRRVTVNLFVAVLVVTSGCNALIDGDKNETTPTQVTPASVPTAESTSTPVPHLAPGLTKYGLRNTSALIDAHTEFLVTTSFTVREVWTLTRPNGTVAARRVITTRVEGNNTYRTYTFAGYPGPIPARETWYGHDRTLQRTMNNSTVSYYRLSRDGPSHREAIPELSAHIYHAFEPSQNLAIERFNRNNTTLYRLERTFQNDPSNVTISARLDSRGVIHNYTIREPITYPPVPNATRSIKSIRFTDINTTTVDRPAWYADAINATQTKKPNTTATNNG